MIVILFIVLLIIILLYVYFSSKNHFQVKSNNIIKGNELNLPLPTTFFDKTNIYLGKSIEQTYLTYDTQFKFEISSKENVYQIANGKSNSNNDNEDIQNADKTIVLDGNDTMVDDGYNNYTIKIIGGTGNGQSRKIIDYDSNTKVITVDTAWVTIPMISSDYSIIGLNILENIHTSYSCKNIGALCNIYKSMCIFDLHEQFKSRNCIFHNINYSLLYSIIIPYYYIHKYNLKLNKNIVYNSYISKSLIYTHHNILEEYSNNQYIYYNILLKLIYSIHNNKNKEKIVEIYNKYKCNYKVFNYYTKLANLIYTKKISKNMLLEFNKLVK